MGTFHLRMMKSMPPCLLTINAGSSSIRFAIYEAGKTPKRKLDGKIDQPFKQHVILGSRLLDLK